MNKTTYEVRYVGAPYGEGSDGELISRHASYDAAVRAMQKAHASARNYGNVKIARRTDVGLVWVRGDGCGE